jgi:hypothetical protein
MTLAAMWETGYGNSGTFVCYIDRFGEVFQSDRYPQSVHSFEVELVYVFTVERHKNVDTCCRIIAIDH